MLKEKSSDKNWGIEIVSQALDHYQQRRMKDEILMSLVRIWVNYFFERDNIKLKNNSEKDFEEFNSTFLMPFSRQLEEDRELFEKIGMILLLNDLKTTSENMGYEFKHKNYSKFLSFKDEIEGLLELK